MRRCAGQVRRGDPPSRADSFSLQGAEADGECGVRTFGKQMSLLSFRGNFSARALVEMITRTQVFSTLDYRLLQEGEFRKMVLKPQ